MIPIAPIPPIIPILPITPIPRYAPNAGSRCSGASRKMVRCRAVNSGAAAITLIATAYCRLTKELDADIKKGIGMKALYLRKKYKRTVSNAKNDMEKGVKSERLLSVDIMRGITVAGMIDRKSVV